MSAMLKTPMRETRKSTGTRCAKSTKSRKRSLPPVEQRYPEVSLPFVNFVGPSRDLVRQCDCWAPPGGGNGLTQDLAGRRYALLAIRFMREHREANRAGPAHGLLTNIIDAMVRKGRFWDGPGGGPFGDADFAAIGFVARLGDILVLADQMGLVDMCARGDAARIDAALARPDDVPSWAREALQDAARERWQFVGVK